MDELQLVVGRADRVKALGSRHSFSGVADTDGVHVSLDSMPHRMELRDDNASVTCGGGVTHSELSRFLHASGRALPNLASLPHISVAGAIQTGTHGSGGTNAALSAYVLAVSLVTSEGENRVVTRESQDFPALVVGLGAFGVIHRVLQTVVPAFDVEQSVHVDVPWRRVLPQLEAVMASGYSVSLFSRFDGDVVSQIWVKRRVGAPRPMDVTTLGGRQAGGRLHPLPDTPTGNVTEQLGVAGPSHERLPHFRHEFKPGRGDEIQSEYVVDVEQGTAAIEALRTLAHLIGPLLHMGEIRRVAPDDAWMSPSAGRHSLALHFTWRREPAAVRAALARVEDALLPLGARPHWGKVFVCDHSALRDAYPRLLDFARVVERWDPAGKFSNEFLDRVLGR